MNAEGRARVWAALLACGSSAFASHWTAAVWWAMRRREPEVIDVSMVGPRAPRLEGVRVWRAERLVVEVDGLRTHGTAVAFAADRTMDAELVAAGWRVLRFTAVQLRDSPLLVATRIAQALALAA